MLNYWFQYDKSTGIIYPYLQETSPQSSTTIGVLGPYPQDTATAEIVMAYTYPNRFLVQNGQLVEQPFFTLAATQGTNQYTITATLNNPPTTPPTSATFTVAGTTLTETLINNVATLTLGIHPSVANQLLNVSVSATGCVGAQTQIGGTRQDVGLQVYTPSGGIPTVAPVGPGSLEFLSYYYATLMPELASVVNAGVAINLLMDVVFNVILPAMQKSTYTPISLDANQQNALSDIQKNLLPNIYTKLENAYPSGGTPQVQYANMVQAFQAAYKAFTQYMADVASIPGLQ